MTVTAKDLRFNVSMLFDVLTKGEDITITYRGRPKARLVSYDDIDHHEKSSEMFGMWKDKEESVDDMVRTLRKGRVFDV